MTGDNMNIVYTGATSGIARTTISYLKRIRDVQLYLLVHNKEQIKPLQELYQENCKIHIWKMDITKETDYHKLDSIHVDVVVHNAATTYGGSLFELSMEKVRDHFEVNVFGTLQFTQYLFHKFQKQGHGRMVYISSLAGVIPIPFIGSYASTKASISMMVKIMQKEAKKLDFPLEIVLVEPGLYHTGFNNRMFLGPFDEMKSPYFQKQKKKIEQEEQRLLKLFERKSKKTIARQIYHAITDQYPKAVYRAPFFQSIGAKFYQLFL